MFYSKGRRGPPSSLDERNQHDIPDPTPPMMNDLMALILGKSLTDDISRKLMGQLIYADFTQRNGLKLASLRK